MLTEHLESEESHIWVGVGAPVYAEVGGQIRGSQGTVSRAGHSHGVSGEAGSPAALRMVISRTP